MLVFGVDVVVFYFKQKTAYDVRISDWSSDVCSSDLGVGLGRCPGGCAGDEHRAQDVGALEQLSGGAGEAHLALLHEHGPLGEVERDVHRLLDDDDGGAAAVDLLHHLEELAHDRDRKSTRLNSSH